MMRRLNRALLAAVGGLLLAPVALPMAQAGLPAAIVLQPENATDWAKKLWEAAAAGDQAEIDRLLAARPEGIDADGRLAKSVAKLQADIAARETKRAKELARVTEDLGDALKDADAALKKGESGGLEISQALKSAVEMHMLAVDKEALMREERITSLIEKADTAARAAEAKGEWLLASELYYRLDLLLEEKGTYKDDVKRETQRLAMIRMYAPKRMWELRNERRNAEIKWDETHKQDEKPGEDTTARQRERRPLPPYNPKGDNYQQKLEGIDEGMVSSALDRAIRRHVERTPMERALRSGLDGLRTMVMTEDLKSVFPGIADAAAREAFLRYIDAQDEKLARPNVSAGTAELLDLLNGLPRINDQTVKLPRTALLHEFANGAMASLDEFSAIIWPDEIRRFNRNTQARFKGVGVQIELDPMSNIRVVTPLDGTPAQRAGIRSGDLIKKVDGDSTEGFSLDQAVDVITGPGDTKVTLTIEREVAQEDGTKVTKEMEFPLVRKEVPITTVKGWKRTGGGEDDWDWVIDPASKIGYVRLLQFSDNTDQKFDRAIEQMKAAGINGLILDLRFNPGGLLDQAVAITSRFVDRNRTTNFKGMVVTTHNKENALIQQERIQNGRASLAGVPIVVLINEGSASASEIVSGAIQDYAKAGDAKAVLMGARSYGKGSVQNVWPLAGAVEAAIKITTQYYHLPAGRKIHHLPAASDWGVRPNLMVDMLPNQITESLILRQNADVLRIDENSKPEPNAKPANADDLLAKGMDLQLEQALVLLQAQVAAKGGANQAMLEKPDTKPHN